MSLNNQLWVEKYRPKTTSDYVFVDEHQRQQVEDWIKNGSIPHLLFTGGPGTGKTTLAKVLINELGVEEYDVMEINASRENGIDNLRTKINGFVETMPFGKFKIVLLDEADYLSQHTQAALRNDMEAYHMTVRYILTCNYPHKIIPALRSRCQDFHVAKPDIDDFMIRAATVLVNENINADPDTLDIYVRATYPDLRKCLNQLQSNSGTGTLLAPQHNTSDADAMLIEVTAQFKSGKITEGRQTLLQFLDMNPTRCEDIFTWMYQNLDLWGKTNEEKDAAIIIIRDNLAKLSFVAIPEIAVAATITELTQ